MKESDAKEMMCPVLSGIVMTKTEESTDKSVFHTYTFAEENCKGKGCAMWCTSDELNYLVVHRIDLDSRIEEGYEQAENQTGVIDCEVRVVARDKHGDCGYKTKECGGCNYE